MQDITNDITNVGKIPAAPTTRQKEVSSPPPLQMPWPYAEDHLTHTEGALIETLRMLRRIETDPEARALHFAWGEIRGGVEFDNEDRHIYCDDHEDGELLLAAVNACEAFISVYKARRLKQHAKRG